MGGTLSLGALSLLTAIYGKYAHRRLYTILGTLGLSSQAILSLAALRLTRGPHASLRSVVMQTETPTTIGGHVDPRFEKVRNAFFANFAEGHELGAQLVVYYKGEKVIDLWGHGENGGHGPKTKSASKTQQQQRPYDAESLQVIFSCSKVLVSICVAMAVDQGWLAYDAPICKYWPAFASKGKHQITVAELMRHEAGLSFLTPFKMLTTKQMGDPAFLASLFESSAPAWAPGEDAPRKPVDLDRGHIGARRSYHAYTRGFIMNEIFKRAEPRGRSIGQFLNEEIAQKLGLGDNLFMGNLPISPGTPRDRFVPVAETSHLYFLARIISRLHHTWHDPTHPHYLFSSFLSASAVGAAATANKSASSSSASSPSKLPGSAPMSASLASPENFDHLIDNYQGPLPPDCVRRLKHVVTNPYSDILRGILTAPYVAHLNSQRASTFEIPSAGAIANARALGLVAEAMRAGGSVRVGDKTVRLLSEKGICEGIGKPITRYDSVICGNSTMTQAGFCWFDTEIFPSYIKDFVGWGGIGGSFMCWSPSREIAFAYCITGHAPAITSMFGATDFRCCRIIKKLLECVPSPPVSRL